MIKRFLVLPIVVLLYTAFPALAQQSTVTGAGPLVVTAAPTGPCGAQQQAVILSTGATYSCANGVWTIISGGGGGGPLDIAQTPLTVDQDILFDVTGVLGRLPLVNVNTCLGNTAGQWASIACNNLPGGTNQQLQYNNAGSNAGFGSFDSGTLLVTLPGALSTTSDGTHAADFGLIGNTTYFTPTANTAGFAGPSSASFTGWRFGLPSTPCTANTAFIFGSASGGVTPITCAAVPHSSIAATAVTPGSYTNANITVAADGSVTSAANGAGGGGSGGAAGGYAQTFTGQTSVTITGATHTLGTANIIVGIYDNASPAAVIEPAKVTIDGTTFDVVVTFNGSQTGTIVLVAGASKYVAAFGSTTSLSVTAATHKLGASIFHVTVYDASSGTRNRVEPNKLSVDASGNVTVTFAASQAGQIVIE